MGIFGKKKEDKKETEKSVSKKVETKKAETLAVVKPTKVSLANNSAVIKRPRITEKAALLSDQNVYTFEVKAGATKYEVRDAIKSIYNVTPVKVNIVNRQPRHSMSRSRGRSVMEHGLRKAYVYLKEGERIELV